VSRCSPPPDPAGLRDGGVRPEEIADKLGKQLDLVVNGGYLGEQPTTVVDFSDDEPVLRRRGAGDPTPFE
jgi:tRNA A37 threonylcarbamoyladenosine synthetase subunit TsaC/SUA5/YrdC